MYIVLAYPRSIISTLKPQCVSMISGSCCCVLCRILQKAPELSAYLKAALLALGSMLAPLNLPKGEMDFRLLTKKLAVLVSSS